MTVVALSTKPRRRVRISRLAEQSAAINGTKTQMVKATDPGWIITTTPANPNRTADQRCHPTFSPNSHGDNAVRKIGLVKINAAASARGRLMNDKATNLK